MAHLPIHFLGDDQLIAQWLDSLGIENPDLGTTNLRQIADTISIQTFKLLIDHLSTALPGLSDPDRALNNLERWVRLSPNSLQTLLIANERNFPDLLVLFSTSQYLSDLLIRNLQGRTTLADAWLTVWNEKGKLFSRDDLIRLLMAEIKHAESDKQAMRVLRQFKQRHTLRIGVGDLIAGQRVDHVAAQISNVASAIVESAYLWVRSSLAAIYGQPQDSSGQQSRFVILAMGKLGGMELNYSSDIDLVMVYDESGITAGGTRIGKELSPVARKGLSNQEFYERLCQKLVKLIGETTELGTAYRVDLRLRPNGAGGKICGSVSSLLQYYDLQGRTWERQALIKATPIAGDLTLGDQLLSQLTHWIYHRNLSRADIGGIKALKRKIERRALESGGDRTNVKTGHGGIRDVEFIIQFMQLLNGRDLPEIRTTNTLDAIQRLERQKCLSSAESTVLSKNYRWLRKLEHRLQIMFDLQTHSIPTAESELIKIAKRMGFVDQPSATALTQFRHTLNETTESNRTILNHLLHGAFGMAFGSMRDTNGTEYRLDRQEVPLEVDLILDPDPDQEMKDRLLRSYGFQETAHAFNQLMELAREPTQFLSSRRCKHFLASVAPALLAELAQTPDPDAALVTLAAVSNCLGGKGVLWELFSFNPPTLSLYVKLCASSNYLVGILKSNPGMIDELVDALQLGSLPSREWLESNIEELTRGATDLSPILHGFKNTQHMRVGIRDILGRDDVRDTHRALAEVAELCLVAATRHLYDRMLDKYGKSDSMAELRQHPCPLVIIGLGKLGGREPNYHSDLDVIFLYDSSLQSASGKQVGKFDDLLRNGVTSQFFFSELAASITGYVAHCPRYGQLYEIDSRLRPTGKSGSLAVSTYEFQRYFASGQGQVWERMALCKARPVFGSPANAQRAMSIVQQAITATGLRPEMATEIYNMRLAMQKDCSPLNLKRGRGGTVDVEFATQLLQLKHASSDRNVLIPGTLEAIEKLVSLEYLDPDDGQCLSDGYQRLRGVEARLRLMNTSARHDLPVDEKQLAALAALLNYADAKLLCETVKTHRSRIRQVFESLFRGLSSTNDTAN